MKKKVFGLIILHLLSLNKGNAKSHSSNLNSLRFENKLQKNSITISGIVKDKESGETLPFANVFVKDTNIGTTTNEDGFFTLFNVPSETSTLQVQYIGYKVEILVLNQEIVKNKIIILLIPDDNQLDEVVVSNDPGQQIIGIDSLKHLKSNIEKINEGISEEVISRIDSIQIKKAEILNPNLWAK